MPGPQEEKLDISRKARYIVRARCAEENLTMSFLEPIEENLYPRSSKLMIFKPIAECHLPFQPTVNLTLDEQIVAAAMKSNLKKVDLITDEDGNILIDKDKNPEVYDWAVNG